MLRFEHSAIFASFGQKIVSSVRCSSLNSRSSLEMLQMFLFLFVFVATIFPTRAQIGGGPNSINPADPVVATRFGLVRGSTYKVTSQTQLGRTYQFLQFIGVPYAAPPTGSSRFRPATFPNYWNNELDCTGSRRVLCRQIEPRFRLNSQLFLREDEDCLHLNIYVPIDQLSLSLPVLVYFHGGEFKYGGKDLYRPDYLYEAVMPSNARGMVVVTVNYRLGIFGFLSTDDTNQPGNNGIRDQMLALQWIQENIAVFHGNPRNVTIMGHDAGAVSVGMHILNSDAKQYFSSAISISGSVFSPWAFEDVPVDQAQKFGYNFGCDYRTDRLVECLRYADADKMIALSRDSHDWERNIQPYWFKPVVDRNVSGSSILKDFPLQLYKNGDYARVPHLVIGTSREGSLDYYLQSDRIRNFRELEQKIAFLIRPHLKAYTNEEVMASAFAFRYFNRSQRVATGSSSSGTGYGQFAGAIPGQNNLRPINDYGYLNSLGSSGLGSNSYSDFVQGYSDLEAHQIFVSLMSDFLYLGPLDYTARLHSASAETIFAVFDYLGLTSKSFGTIQDKAPQISRDTYGVTHMHDLWFSWHNEYDAGALPLQDRSLAITYSKFLAEFVLFKTAQRQYLRYSSFSPNYQLIKGPNIQVVVAKNGVGYRTEHMDFINNYIYRLQDQSAYFPPWFPSESYKAYQSATWSLVGLCVLLIIAIIIILLVAWFKSKRSGDQVTLKKRSTENDPLNRS